MSTLPLIDIELILHFTELVYGQKGIPWSCGPFVGTQRNLWFDACTMNSMRVNNSTGLRYCDKLHLTELLVLDCLAAVILAVWSGSSI